MSSLEAFVYGLVFWTVLTSIGACSVPRQIEFCPPMSQREWCRTQP